MTSKQRKSIRHLGAAVAAAALLISGCSSTTGEPTAVSSDQPVTLKLATFGDAPYVKDQIAAFEKEHSNITVEWNRAATEADARTNMFTKLAAGSGLSDVEQAEAGWVAQLRDNAKLFYPVASDNFGENVAFTVTPVTTEDGTQFGYPGGTGPTAICYRSELLKAAGMPSDPDSVAKMVGGSWDDFFAAGKEYVAGGGKGWFDSAYMLFDSQMEQMPFPYEKADGTVVADSPEVEKVFKDTLKMGATQSAGFAPFSEDWNSAIGSGKFATMVCPSWMLAVVQGNSPKATTWNIANGFPNGGGNLGGSFWVIPKQSKHPAEAAMLASYISSPEAQIEGFAKGGAFPSRVKALDDPALLKVTNSFFNDAPTGKIFAERAKAIKEVIFKGPHFIDIDTAAFDAFTRVETGQQSIDDAWTQFAAEVGKLK